MINFRDLDLNFRDLNLDHLLSISFLSLDIYSVHEVCETRRRHQVSPARLQDGSRRYADKVSRLHCCSSHGILLQQGILFVIVQLYVAPLYIAPLYIAPLYVALLYVAPLYVAQLYMAQFKVAPLHVAPFYIAPLNIAPL